ncbi:hypothetical protein [Methyloceanibacter marginalis]|uniref:hypothetical protein n=1 Tax=Methyloceanibacter marginalis TaxID=1774971 RepID=UPI00114CEE93|nr:hypothetical protein [Methyloceanibacter marginalis]
MTANKRKEAPLDPFKRAVSLTTRSLAADSSVEVVFSTEAPGPCGQDRAGARALSRPDPRGDRGDPRSRGRGRPVHLLPR